MTTDQQIKDPDAILDYRWDWSDWLARAVTDEEGEVVTPAETITASQVLPDPGVTVDSDDHDDTTATVWLSGGEVDTTYRVTNRITTSQQRTDDRTMRIRVRQR